MDKIALFGGTFDPIHLGHRDCIQYLVETMIFSKVILIPTNQNPLKIHQKPASMEDRLKMMELTLTDYCNIISIDSSEIIKQKPSYTFETLKHYVKKHLPEDLHFVMGLDTFLKIDQWKNFNEILEMTNLLVISRPSCHLDLKYENLPQGIQARVRSFKKSFALIDTGRRIDFQEVKTRDISSFLVRKKLKTGQNLGDFIDSQVEKYIKKNNVYPDRV